MEESRSIKYSTVLATSFMAARTVSASPDSIRMGSVDSSVIVQRHLLSGSLYQMLIFIFTLNSVGQKAQ